jgi:hypothetical protein
MARHAECPQPGKLHQKDRQQEKSTASQVDSLTPHSTASRVPERNPNHLGDKMAMRLRTDNVDSQNGTWKVVNGAAQCKWEDGWTDVIRRNASLWEKAAWSSGRSLDDPPDSVAEAVYTEPN